MSYIIDNALFGKNYAKHNSRLKIEKQKTVRAELRREIAKQKERDSKSKRKQKEVEKANNIQKKQLEEAQKAEILKENKLLYEEYLAYIQDIQSVHKIEIEEVNWREVNQEPQPQKVDDSFVSELWEAIKQEGQYKILNQIEHFKPSFQKQLFDKIFQKQIKNKLVQKITDSIFKTDKEKLKKLHSAYEQAKKDDIIKLEEVKTVLQESFENWQTLQIISRGVLEQDIRQYIFAINYLDCFSDLKEYGSNINFKAEKNALQIEFYVNSESVVPKTEKTLAKNGSILEKEMPISTFNEIYQDYVCSCVLRIGREVFALLPINYLHINIFGLIFNSVTGNNEECCILSVVIDKPTFSKLNFKLLDPSDSMQNFRHNMKFDKKKGFQKAEILSLNFN